MECNSTQLDTVRFIYGEMTEEEATDHCDILLTDQIAFEEFEEMDTAYQMLKSVKMKPRQACLDRIMDYSKLSSLSPEE